MFLRASCLWGVRDRAWILTTECVDRASCVYKPQSLYTGGVAAGQLWASVIRVLGMLEGSGPVGKDLFVPRGRWPEELREKGAVTK